MTRKYDDNHPDAGVPDTDNTLFDTLQVQLAGAWVLIGCFDSATGLWQGEPFETDEDEIECAAAIAAEGGDAIFYSYRHRRTAAELIVRLSRAEPDRPWALIGFEQFGFMEDAWIDKNVPAVLLAVHAKVRAPDRGIVR